MTPPRDNHPQLTLLGRARPARSGQPWTDSDYERLLALVRGGSDAYDIAVELERSDAAVAQRLRALLPPEERSCLADRVLPTLRMHLCERPDYPWAEIMVQSPPPAPVVKQVIERHGLPGLEDAELTEVAWAMLNCETSDERLLRDVCSEVTSRSLASQLTDRLARALERRTPPLTPDEATHAASARFARASGRRTDPYHRHAPYEGTGCGSPGYW